MKPTRFSLPGNSYFHAYFPESASIALMDAVLPAKLFTNTLPSAMEGAACGPPLSSTRQSSRGGLLFQPLLIPVSGDVPSPFGPRIHGQSEAFAATEQNAPNRISRTR